MMKSNSGCLTIQQSIAHTITAVWLLLLLQTLCIQGIFQVTNQFNKNHHVLSLCHEGDIPCEQENTASSSAEESNENPSSVFTDYLPRTSEAAEYYPLMRLQFTSGEEIPFLLIQSKTIPTPPPEC